MNGKEEGLPGSPEEGADTEETAGRRIAIEQSPTGVEQALRESEERLRLAAQCAGFGTYDADLTTGELYWSPEMRAIAGVPPDVPTIRAGGVPSFVHPEDRPHVHERMQASFDPAGTGEFEDEHRLLWADGSVRWVLVKGRTIFLGEGPQRRAVRATGFVVDITVRKQAEEALRRWSTELEERVAARTQDLATTHAALQAEMEERLRAERSRREVLRELVSSEEAERRRISRDLHDQLGQQISALKIKLALLRSRPNLEPAIGRELEIAEQLARQADEDIDAIVWALRPRALEESGLLGAIDDLVAGWSRLWGIPATLHRPLHFPYPTGEEIQIVLYRFVQEALNNAIKHSGASKVDVTFLCADADVSLAVVDDGCGFDPTRKPERGYGLAGMRERAELLGGSFELRSAPGQGTQVSIRLYMDDGARTRSLTRDFLHGSASSPIASA